MRDFLLLMHDDGGQGGDWDAYFQGLRNSGAFDGGSAIGDGACFRKTGDVREIAGHIGGFIRVRADSLDDARRFLVGNPVYETGGTVEIRELPRG